MTYRDQFKDLHKEISQFRSETRHRLEVIENEINKQIALNYNRTIIDYVIDMSKDLVTNMKCDIPASEDPCKTKMIGLQEEYMKLLKSGKFDETLISIDTALQKLGAIRQDFVEIGRPGCVSCLDNEARLMESNIQLLSQLKLIETPAISLVQNKATIDSMNAEKTSDMIISPISHKVRIQILQSIYKGENRFNDLSKATGLKGGQLLYHIKKLKGSGYLDQFESRDYVLSTKGMKALIMLAQLSHEVINVG